MGKIIGTDEQRLWQLTFRQMAPSEFVEAKVREQMERLFDLNPRIVTARVAIERVGRRMRHGNTYQIRIDLVLPGREVVLSHQLPLDRTHENAYVAIHDAFDAVVRQLGEGPSVDARRRARRRLSPQRGTVLRVFPADGFGFLRSEDGREIYFHENSVLRGVFSVIDAGDRVRFSEEQGAEGPQASTVELVRRAKDAGLRAASPSVQSRGEQESPRRR